MAPTLVEHVVADAAAFLKKAPLQVRFHRCSALIKAFRRCLISSLSCQREDNFNKVRRRFPMSRPTAPQHHPLDFAFIAAIRMLFYREIGLVRRVSLETVGNSAYVSFAFSDSESSFVDSLSF